MAARALTVWVALAIAGGLLTGCVPDTEPEPTAPFTTEAEAFAAAEATYRAYVDALNRVDLSDPETFEDVYAWTTGDANSAERQSLSGMHAEGWNVQGSSTLMSTVPVSAELSNPARVTIVGCLDVTDVRLVDEHGESVVSPDRPPVQTVLVVAIQDSSTPTGLIIDSLDGREASECSAE
ncbi:hypothetical protein GCM10022200_02500 [Microbacterium awajiense]|uniref:Lipoprotein n=1 Tax=Microbacterium awajiense TaxID=415214 RepID=A0ABP7A2M6_9MICO